MAAQDFNNNILNPVQAMLMDTFRAKNYTPVFKEVPSTVVGLAMRQTATLSPIIAANNDRNCAGYEGHFMNIDSRTLPTFSDTAVTAACTITGGDGMTGNHVDFAPDIFAVTPYQYDSHLCNTVFNEQEVVRELVIAAMHKHMMAFNAESITRINTNKQTATYASDIGTISGGDVYISDLSRWSAKNIGSDLMPYLDDIAHGNNLPQNYLILGGSQLAVAAGTAQYIGLNDNERSELAAFQAYGDRLIIDQQGMANASLRDSIFLIDPNVYGIYVHNQYDTNRVNTGDTNNTQVFSLPLTYVANGKDGGNMQVEQFSWSNGGQMTPARVDFRAQINCNENGGRQGRPSFLNNLQAIFEAAMLFAPANGTGQTGIIKVTRGTP